MAADSYFRIKGKPAVVNVTTGPGGINALNGVYGAYVDSVPMIIVSGQIKTEHLVKNINPDLRQFGDQEACVLNIVEKITKARAIIENKKNVVQKFNKLIVEASSGRKGPVWIDIPLDVQAASVNITPKQITKITKNYISKFNNTNGVYNKKDIYNVTKLVSLIKIAKRPLIIVGNGIRFSDNLGTFKNFLSKLDIPVCTVWNSHDLVPNKSYHYAGRPGADGERAGNFNMQNCDLLIILGARMHVRQVGFNEKSFAREAIKVMVDIDKAELDKPNLGIDLKLNIDLSKFFNIFNKVTKGKKIQNKNHREYLSWCKKNVKELKVVEDKHLLSKRGKINPYLFVKVLFNNLGNSSQVITGDGTAAVVTFKAAEIKQGQRLFTNKGCASMGYDLPALIGSLYSDHKKKKILITGDGSIMMNLQELSSLKPFLDKDIKIFVLNNDGYHSIRQSQVNYFDGYEVGVGETSNLYMPNFKKIAMAFGLKYLRVTSQNSLLKAVKDNSACIKFIEVMIDKDQAFEPRVSSKKLSNGKMVSSPLEEMEPLLEKEDFLKRMIIPIAENSNYE